MIINVIGCGATGANWDGNGYSIGVNDCWKFGKKTNDLIVVNKKPLFSEKRLLTICNSKPVRFLTNLASWLDEFPDGEIIPLKRWNGVELDETRNTIYHSKTSPFIAMSLAYDLCAKEIVLWGVDFVDHHAFSPGKTGYLQEKIRYEQFAKKLAEKNVMVYKGSKESNLNLPIWKQS